MSKISEASTEAEQILMPCLYSLKNGEPNKPISFINYYFKYSFIEVRNGPIQWATILKAIDRNTNYKVIQQNINKLGDVYNSEVLNYMKFFLASIFNFVTTATIPDNNTSKKIIGLLNYIIPKFICIVISEEIPIPMMKDTTYINHWMVPFFMF